MNSLLVKTFNSIEIANEILVHAENKFTIAVWNMASKDFFSECLFLSQIFY